MINKTILKIIIIIALLVGMNFYVNEYNIDDAKQIDSINVNKNDFIKINRHSPYLSITLPKYYQYYL
mgnify:CR=1 FL=1